MPDVQYKKFIFEITLQDGTTHQIPFAVPIGEDGGIYTPVVNQISDTEIEIGFTPSKEGMPSVAAKRITIPAGKDYALTDVDKAEIAEIAAGMVNVPGGGGGSTDLTGYATEQWVKDQNYLTEHQDISGKLDASKLPEAINTALAQAKASGEFDGHSPVRGEDYWTEADIAEIKSYVDEAILGGAW
jgi:hypothetical protein